jgi:coenzyme PQQ precursor peptide PqqA
MGRKSKGRFSFLDSKTNYWEMTMKTKVWTRPNFEEVSLGCEINCYAPAE